VFVAASSPFKPDTVLSGPDGWITIKRPSIPKESTHFEMLAFIAPYLLAVSGKKLYSLSLSLSLSVKLNFDGDRSAGFFSRIVLMCGRRLG